jgi:DNA polymerase V
VKEKVYAAIDLKSFYSSVECIERGLDPLTTSLVVADKSRTEKTICLAVTPALKSYGIPGRARLFEVVQRVKEVNWQRQRNAPGRSLTGSSPYAEELAAHPELALDYIVAPPRMALYMEYSTRVYQVYLKYIAPEDIISYSIDEVLVDVTPYLKTYQLSPRDLVKRMMLDVLETTGITATAGIGPNLYLAKIAMDIWAKRIPPDKDGVRIAQLDETSYRKNLWGHRPLTDFWRVGPGYAKKLEAHGMLTMGDVARRSIQDEDSLYRLFGVNAELLIDHAWGWEPCTIADVKAYKPETNSIGSGQVLQHPYTFEKAQLVVHEMADALALDLVGKGMVTNQLVLTVGYDIENLTDPERRKQYKGPVTVDRYGRSVPKHAHGTEHLTGYSCSAKEIVRAALALFDRVVDGALLIRRLNLTACDIIPEGEVPAAPMVEQLDLFTDYSALKQRQAEESAARERERRMQEAILRIKGKYGKNAILKVHSLEDGATAMERNGTIGGHKA